MRIFKINKLRLQSYTNPVEYNGTHFWEGKLLVPYMLTVFSHSDADWVHPNLASTVAHLRLLLPDLPQLVQSDNE